MAKIKTKFDSLVKLKKMKVDEFQNHLTKMNNQLKIEEDNLSKMQQEFASLTPPKEGNFGIIIQFKNTQQDMLKTINNKKNQIEFIKGQIRLIKENLKNAELEYEKMKYLQAEEIKKYIKKLKDKEAKYMDEIALLLFKKDK